jgi:hypothetical protein
MPDNTQLTVENSRFPTANNWSAIMEISKHLSESKALPTCIQNASQLTMVLLAGKEAGMGAMESLNAYYIVNGKITIYGQATLVQLKRAGYKVKWGECDDKSATVTITTPDGTDSNTETFTMAEAVKSGNTGKDVWQKHAKSMIRWKALAANIRFFCPEVLNGYYVREDLEGTTDRPEVIEATVEQPKSEIDEIVPDSNPNRKSNQPNE